MLFSSKDIRKLILPLMFEQLLAVSVGLVDTFMVSRAGDAAISGVALVDNINRLIIQIMAALATGGAVVCSQYIGKKDDRQSRKSGAQLTLIMTMLAIVVVIIAILFTRNILTLIFGHVERDVMNSGVLYFTVTAFSFPFLALYNSGAAIFRSQGNSKISMQISIIMNVVNIVGNVIFVFGLNINVLGVALATLISRVVAGFIMLYYTVSSKNPLRCESIKDYRFDYFIIKKILSIGIPSGVENGMFQIGKLLVVSFVSTFGTASIAANAVGYTVIDFINIPASSMGLALITVVGRCIGAGKKEQAKMYSKRLLRNAYIGDWICNAFLFVMAPYLCGLFNLSSEAHTLAVTVLRCFAIASLPIWPLSFTIPNALRAAGDISYTMICSIISMWIFRVGSSYFLGVVCGFGIVGVWAGMFIDWFARSVMFMIRFVSGKWLQRKALV